MAAIKSTLDLIMEKTSNLSLSDDEKKQHELDAVKQRLKGLVQKFQDNALRIQQFTDEFEKLEQDHDFSVRKLLFDEIFERITLEEDVSALARLVSDFFNAPAVLPLYETYREKLRAATEQAMKGILTDLKEKYGISGSAVKIPLQSTKALTPIVEHITKEFNGKMKQEKKKLTKDI